MPLSSIGTYVPTMQEIQAHWTAVNAVGVMTLQGGFTLADFTTLTTEADTAIADVEGLINLRTTAAGDRDIKRAAIRERIRQFRAAVTAQLPGSRYLRSLPKLPNEGAGSAFQLKALDDMKNLWTTINANTPAIPGFTPPLTLASGYTLMGFTIELSAMRIAYGAVQTADQNAQQGRETRDQKLAQAKSRMMQYRQACIAHLPTGHALLATIPAVTPPPGSTPPAANLGGVWNETSDMADLTWVYPDLDRIDHFQLRHHPGPKYKTSEETVVPGFSSIDKNDTTLSTDHTLTAPGSVALFKIYAITADGNEKGSNAVKIIRG